MSSLELAVPGMHCAHCLRTVEQGLVKLPGVAAARANLSTKRVRVETEAEPATIVAALKSLGFDANIARAEPNQSDELKGLIRALAVAAFGSMNIMLLAVAVWAGLASDMEAATRTLFYWLQAMICIPTVAYAGMPFFRSAAQALRHKRLNMDVPISLAVIITPLVSILEVIREEPHAYFDGAVMLLLFLLVGRVLDRKVRAQAWSVAENLLALQAVSAEVVDADGRRRTVTPDQLRPGMQVAVAMGARIPADGVVVDGRSDLDLSLVTGETLPEAVLPGGQVFAGTLNLTGPLLVQVSKAADQSLVAELVRLMESAEQTRSRYVRVADRLAAAYAPAVHILSAATFVGWLIWGPDWHAALMAAVAVLIITCPCALGLAMPVVQVAAVGQLLRRGVVVKSGDALERLAEVDCIVFDKTGTLTLGEADLASDLPEALLVTAAAVARFSRHPLSKALVRAAGGRLLPTATAVSEHPGLGLEAQVDGQTVRLGAADWVGVPQRFVDGPHLWLRVGDGPAVLVRFQDSIRGDAVDVVGQLLARGLQLHLLSGDSAGPVAVVAEQLGLPASHAHARVTPADKARLLETLRAQGRKTLMVGDGLNDGPALRAAHVSMAPASGADIAQGAADLVFQGDKLAPVLSALAMGRSSQRLAVENFILAIGYNLIAVPLAVAGMVTPLIAAIAMSTSSILVVLNALRLNLPQGDR